MTSHYLEFDPAIIEKRQVYRLLTGAVVPRPIGWASTVNKGGITNLAPFSFFTVVCVIPPMISLTIARSRRHREAHAQERARNRRILLQRGDRAGVAENGGFGQCIRGHRFRVRQNRSYADPECQNRGAACQGGSDSFRVQARARARTRLQPASFGLRRSSLYACRSSL